MWLRSRDYGCGEGFGCGEGYACGKIMVEIVRNVLERDGKCSGEELIV